MLVVLVPTPQDVSSARGPRARHSQCRIKREAFLVPAAGRLSYRDSGYEYTAVNNRICSNSAPLRIDRMPRNKKTIKLRSQQIMHSSLLPQRRPGFPSILSFLLPGR